MKPLLLCSRALRVLAAFGLWITFISSANAQNGLIGAGFSSGWSNPSNIANFSAGAGSSRIYVATPSGTGNQYFRMVRNWSGGGAYDSQYSEYAQGAGSDYAASIGVETNEGLSNNGFAYYFNVSSTSDRYVFKTPDGPQGLNFICFKMTGASPSTISSISHSPSGSAIYAGTAVTVTANLNTAFPAGQAAYIRYTTDAYATSSVVAMSGSGTTYTGVIPGQANGASVAYYVFTSGNGLTITGAKADWYSINISSGGSYTPAGFISNAATDWNTGSTWLGGNVPTAGAAATLAHAVTANSTITNAVASVTINSGASLTVGASGTVNITSGGTLTNNSATASMGNATGTINFQGAGTIAGNATTFGKLTLGGSSGTVTQSVAAVICTTFACSTNVTYSPGANALSIAAGGTGSFTNNGIFTAGSSTFTTLGVASLNGTSATTFNIFNMVGSANVTDNIASVTAATCSLAFGGGLILGSNTLNISAGGTFTTAANNSAIGSNGTTGTIVFLGTGTFAGSANLFNLTLNGALTNSGTVGVNGTLQMNSGATLTTAPVYGSASTLSYNATFNPDGFEWTATTDGAAGTGRPFNVNILTGTVTLTADRAMAGKLTISSGAGFVLGTSAAINFYIRGDWENNGTNLTYHVSTLIYFSSTSATQSIKGVSTVAVPSSVISGGTNITGEKLPNLIINGSQNVQLLSDVYMVNTGNALLRWVGNTPGTLDLNAKDLYLSSGNSLLQANGTNASGNIGNTNNSRTSQLYILTTNIGISNNNGSNNYIVIGAGVNMNIAPSSNFLLNGKNFTVNGGLTIPSTSAISKASSTTNGSILTIGGSSAISNLKFLNDTISLAGLVINHTNASDVTLSAGTTIILKAIASNALTIGGTGNLALNGSTITNRATGTTNCAFLSTGGGTITSGSAATISLIGLAPAISASSTQPVTLGANITLSLASANPTVFDLNGKSLSVNGLTLNGSSSLKGSAAAVLSLQGNGSVSPLVFANTFRNLAGLTVNRTTSTAISLATDLTLNSTTPGAALSLTGANLDINGNILTLASNASITQEASTTSRIVSTGSAGTVTASSTSALSGGAGTYNIGNLGLSVTVPVNTSTITVTRKFTALATGASSILRYYTIYASAAISATGLTFAYDPSFTDLAGASEGASMALYSGTTTLNCTTTTAQSGNNLSGYPHSVSIGAFTIPLVASTAYLTLGSASSSYTAIATGLWSQGATWSGGSAPPSASAVSVTINSGVTVTLDQDVILNGFTNTSGTLVTSYLSGAYSVTLNTGTPFANNGTISAGTGTNTFILNSSGVVFSGNAFNFQNLTIGAAVNQNFNTTVSGTLSLNASGALSTSNASTLTLGAASTLLMNGGTCSIAPAYTAGATLTYNSGTGAPVTPGSELSTTATTTNISILNNNTTGVTFSGAVNGLVALGSGGILTVTSNSAITGGFAAVSGSTLNVGGSSNLGLDFLPGGATMASGSTINFNRSGSQNFGSTARSFPGVTINTVSGNSLNINSSSTVGSVNIVSGSNFYLTDNTARTLTLSTGSTFANNGTLGIGSGVSTLVFAGTGTISGTAPTFNNLTFGGATTVSVACTVTAAMRMNAGASASGSAIVYGASSSLEYVGTNTYATMGTEWSSGSTSGTPGAGLPRDVTVVSGTLTMPAGTRSLTRNFTIATGATFATTGVCKIQLPGNWSNSGTFTPGSSVIAFYGTSGTQTITNASGAEVMSNLNIDGTANVQLASDLTLNGVGAQINLGISSSGNLDLYGKNITFLSGSDNTFKFNGTGIIANTHPSNPSTAYCTTVDADIFGGSGPGTTGPVTFGTNVTLNVANGRSLVVPVNTNGAALVINGGLTLNTSGNINATKSSVITIGGSGTIDPLRFATSDMGKLTLSHTGDVKLGSNLTLYTRTSGDALALSTCNLDLNGFVLTLGRGCVVTTETASIRIINTGSTTTGYVMAKSDMTGSAVNAGNLGLTITAPASVLYVKRFAVAIANISGSNSSISRYYAVTDSFGSHTATAVTLAYDPAELGANTETSPDITLMTSTAGSATTVPYSVTTSTGTVISGFPHSVSIGSFLFSTTTTFMTGGNASNSYITQADGDWNTGATWAGGVVPPSSAAVTIAHVVTLAATATQATTTIGSGHSLTIGTGAVLTVSSGGTLINNSSSNIGVGTITFAGNATISGSVSLPVSGILDAGGYAITISTAPTISSGGVLRMTAGSTLSAAPTYATGSTLEYAGTVNYSVSGFGNEWSNVATTASPGSGQPYNVTIASGTMTWSTVNQNKAIPGTLTIASGATLVTGNTATLCIAGNWVNNGTYNQTRTQIQFTATGGTQTISKSSGAESFGALRINSAGTVQLACSLTVVGANITNLYLAGTGALDLNGNNLTCQSAFDFTMNSGSTGKVTNSGAAASVFFTTNAATVFGGATTAFTFDPNITVNIADGITLQPNAPGLVIKGGLNLNTSGAFLGSTTALLTIDGSGTISPLRFSGNFNLGKLTLTHTGDIQLATALTLNSVSGNALGLSTCNLDINGNVLTLAKNAVVGTETATVRITNTGSTTTGYVATKADMTGSAINVGNLGITITAPSSVLLVRRYATSVSNVAGAGTTSLTRYFTVADSFGTVTATAVKFSYIGSGGTSELNGNLENKLNVFTGTSNVGPLAANAVTATDLVSTFHSVSMGSMALSTTTSYITAAASDVYFTFQVGDWNTGSTWVGGLVPPSSGLASIGHAITLIGSATINTATVSAGSLTIGGAGTLTIQSGGALINNIGSTASLGTGAVTFAGAASISGTNSFSIGNLLPAGYAITFGSAVPTVTGNLYMTSGSTLSAAPVYGSLSTLVYAETVTPGNEWTATTQTSAAGCPNNVTVNPGFTVTLPSGGGNSRALNGTLTITAGGAFTLSATTNNTFRLQNFVNQNNDGSGFTTSNRTVIFSGSAQSTLFTGTLGQSFDIVNVSNSNGLQLTGGNITIRSNNTLILTLGNVTRTASQDIVISNNAG
ncbi:MAG: hypothetical protein V4543_06985, partial [Bacteroidota bacterium]